MCFNALKDNGIDVRYVPWSFTNSYLSTRSERFYTRKIKRTRSFCLLVCLC